MEGCDSGDRLVRELALGKFWDREPRIVSTTDSLRFKRGGVRHRSLSTLWMGNWESCEGTSAIA